MHAKKKKKKGKTQTPNAKRAIQTHRYSIKINSKPRGHITLTKGLQQGTPYLSFCSCFAQKDFQLYFAKPLAFGVLKGVTACPQGPCISHLFFVDDSIIFCQATLEECNHLARILETYELA